jgi:lipopolysaccharide biosynthesis glycosyltransferase
MREENFSSKVIEFVKKWPTRFHDQDGLNAVSIGKWGTLEPSFNVFVSATRPEFKYTSESVLHYLDPKPWIPTQNKGYERSEIGKAHDAYNKYMYQSGWFNLPERLWHLMSCTFFRYFGGPLRALREMAYGIFGKNK